MAGETSFVQAVDHAASVVGGKEALSHILGVDPAHMELWLAGERMPPSLVRQGLWLIVRYSRASGRL